MNSDNQNIEDIFSLLQEFNQERISDSLRKILMQYLISQDDFPIDFKEIMTDINLLFEFLSLLKHQD